MAREVGRPCELTEEVFTKIKEKVLEGKNLLEISKELEIKQSTLYTWTAKNFLNLSDKIDGWKRDRRLMLAEATSDFIQELHAADGEGNIDHELLRIKQKESEFVRETLGKNYYSKRSELTGANGADLITKDEVILRLQNL